MSTVFHMMMKSSVDLPEKEELKLTSCHEDEERTHFTCMQEDEETVDSLITGDTRDAYSTDRGWDDRSAYSDPLPQFKRRLPLASSGRKGHAWWSPWMNHGSRQQPPRRNRPTVVVPWSPSENSLLTTASPRNDEDSGANYGSIIMGPPRMMKEKDRLKFYKSDKSGV